MNFFPSYFSEFSVVDFFGDDGLNDYVEGSPVQEAHVAFSVEGNSVPPLSCS